MLDEGTQAPNFTLPDATGSPVSLSDLRGQPVVVYFYPRDDTPGCTTQACGIRDQWEEFERAGAQVLGISPDDVASHAKFRTKYDLPHTLLADPDGEVLRAWGAWGTKKMYGREYEGAIRSTVLVDAEGTVARVWPKVRPKDHADDVLAAVRELPST